MSSRAKIFSKQVTARPSPEGGESPSANVDTSAVSFPAGPLGAGGKMSGLFLPYKTDSALALVKHHNTGFPSISAKPAVADHITSVFSQALKKRRADTETGERRRLNRLIGACNEILVRENRENVLYSQLVRVIAGFEGFRSSVIGILADGEDDGMKFAASDPGDLEKCANIGETGEGRNAFAESVADAIASKRTVVVGELGRRGATGARSHQHPADECHSCIVTPIGCAETSLGVLVIFSDDSKVFNDQVQLIVEKIASNLALAIERLGNANARRRAESDLQILSAHRQSILANSIVGIALLRDRHCVWSNARFNEMFGGTEADFAGKSTATVYVSQEDFEDFGERAYPILAAGEVFNDDLQMRRLDGTPIWCRVSGHATSEMRDGESLWIIEDITERKMAQQAAEESEQHTRRALIGTIRCLARTIAVRDSYTAGHQERVAELSVAIAHRMGLSQERILGIEMGALIHDIGKIYIPGEILTRPGHLSNAEFEFIKTHPEVGYQIIADVDMDWPVREIILQHHEHLDGSGYPNGIAGDDIILEARIVAVADTIEAVVSHRPYRPALPLEAGLKIIEEHSGDWFDPDVVSICADLIRSGSFVFEKPET